MLQMTKITILKTILLILFMKCSLQQQICEILNDTLMVPSEGCTLESKARKIQVQKISLSGELIISQEIILKYQSIEISENSQFTLNSKNTRITFEDISQNSCDNIQSVIKLKSFSYYQIHHYDIQMIENNDLLTIVNKSPKQIPIGVKVVIFSESGGVEYSEVESINGQKVKLIRRIKNIHTPSKIRQNKFIQTKFPQIVLLDTNSIHFKKQNKFFIQMFVLKIIYFNLNKSTCINFEIINDQSGLVFEDVKGLKINSQKEQNLSDILIIDNQKNTQQNKIFINAYKQKNLYFVNVQRDLEINPQYYGSENYFFIDSILNQFQINGYYMENINFVSSAINISGGLRYLKGYSMNNIFKCSKQCNEISLTSVILLNVNFLHSNTYSMNIEIQNVVIKGSQFDFSNGQIKKLDLISSFIDGEKKNYFLKMPFPASNQIEITLIANTFYNFSPNSEYIIYAQDFIKYDKAYPFDQVIYKVKAGYLENIQSQKLLGLPNMILFVENKQAITLSQSKFQLYKGFAYRTKIDSFLTSQVILLTENFSTLYFDMGENNVNYNFKMQTSNGQTNLDFKEYHYILLDHHHKIYINVKPEVINPQTKINLRIEIGPVLESKYKMPIKVYFDKKQQIKSILLNQNTLIKFVENTDNSIEINVKDIQDKYTSTVLIINIEFCELNQVIENGQCQSICSIQDSIVVNGVCQNKVSNEYKQIDYFYIVQKDQKYEYVECPFNCKSCTSDSCTSCSNNLQQGQCQDQLAGNYLSKNDGKNYKCEVEFCQICSDEQKKCNTCIDGYKVHEHTDSLCTQVMPNEFVYYEFNYVFEIPNGCKKGYNGLSCHICDVGFTLQMDQCIKNCSAEYIFKDNQCQQTENLILQGYSNYIDKMNFQCLEGYQKIQEKCEKISDTPQNCNGETCYEKNQCIKGMFYSNEKISCIQCGTGCLECLNENQCKTCAEGFIIVNNKCVCQGGYFAEQGDFFCQKCNSQCKECTNSTNNCISCKDETFQLKDNKCICKSGYILQGNQCIKCKSGEFSKDEDTECQKCDDSCQECHSQSSCLTCKSSYILVDNKCVCPEGYFTQQGSLLCQKCSGLCKECINSSNMCISCKDETFQLKNNRCLCKPGYILEGDKCIKCQRGEFSQVGDDKCQKCDDSCLECNSQFSCLICKSQYKMIDSKCILTNDQNNSNDDEDESKNELTTNQIIGVVIGAVFAIMVLAIIIKSIIYMKKKNLLNKQKYQMKQENVQSEKDLFKTENDIEDKKLHLKNNN